MVASVLRISLATAVAAFTRGTASPSQEDVTELVQVGALVDRHGADACQCLSWKDVYANHGLECGAGQELIWAGGMTSKPSLGEEFCTRFYEKLSGNFCTQLYFSKQRTEQWCYVSSACTALNGGGAAGVLKWKQCTPGQDTMLGEMTPEEVHKVAEAENKDPGLVLKMSYPLYEQGLRWPQVRKCIDGDASADCATLKEIRATGKPMIFDSLDGHPPFGVVNGSLAIESHFTPWFYLTMIKNSNDLWESPWKMNDYTCVDGCSH